MPLFKVRVPIPDSDQMKQVEVCGEHIYESMDSDLLIVEDSDNNVKATFKNWLYYTVDR